MCTFVPFDSSVENTAHDPMSEKPRLEMRAGNVHSFKQIQAVGAEFCDTSCDTPIPEKKKPPSLINLEAISFARSRGLEPAGDTIEDLRGSAITREYQDNKIPPRESYKPSADEGVTDGVTPPSSDVVTVPVHALAVLVKLARRFEDEPAITAALQALKLGCR